MLDAIPIINFVLRSGTETKLVTWHPVLGEALINNFEMCGEEIEKDGCAVNCCAG